MHPTALYLGVMTSLTHSVGPIARIVRSMVLVSSFALVAQVALPANPLMAEQQVQRIVQGKVVDSNGAGIKGATVYLKDGRTLAVKSYVANDDGGYRFGQLVQSADYQVWAEANGKKSGVKSISSFDTRNEFNITLKVDTGK